MPSGRAVLLFRRLSTGDSRFKSFNVNQNTKDNHTFAVANKNCEISDLQRSRRFLSSQQLSSPLNQGIPLSCSDHFIRMSSSDSASSQTPTCSKETHKFTNNLINSRSPYLLQHAHNPVDWYPWGQEAFDKAKKEGKLIFLSVGYSTCHWCHVMEKESFENEAVAEIMNANFINIKVDREERPDIDKVYMLFIQATQGHGGWPMSVFLTPDLHPVMGGTYFPPEDKWGRAGFKTILLSLAKKWKNDRHNFNETAKNIIDVLEKAAVLDKPDNQALPGNEVWKKCITMFIKRFDKEFGGFGSQPKFPQPSNLNFLFHAYARNKEDAESKKCLEMCLHSLKKMANGGIHDHISSGFARYSVDHKWHVPHFEKMLYDQAQLAVSYTDAYLATKDKFFADVAHDILKYVNRDLSHETGGFYSAEDADSFPTHDSKEKKEGAFCVWEYDEIESLLSDKTITIGSEGNRNDILYSDIFCYHFNVQKNGNTDGASDPHGELTNKNVLIVLGSKEKTAEKFGITIENLDEVIKYSTDILYQERQNRPRPHLDSKMLCSWNGLMIAGFAKAGQGLSENAYIDRAIKAANFVKQYLYDEKKQLLLRSCYKGDDGRVVQTSQPIYGFLDDYAFLIKGLLELYEASLDQAWLAWARQLQAKQDELFWDKKDGAYFTSSTNDASVVLRLKEDQDGAEPCGNSVSCHNLLRLATYAPEQKGGEERGRAETILVAFGERLAQMPAALPEMISAQMFFIDSPTQVVIAGGAEDPRTLALLSAVRSRLLPGRVLAAFDPSLATNAPDANMAGMSDILLSRVRPGNGTPTAYVCRRYSCSLPVTDAAQLERLLDEPVAQPTQKQASATD